MRLLLFVCKDHPYLAATPDGVIDDDHIVEVKCPYVGRNSTIKPGPMFPFLLKINQDIQLKKTHSYYYQIQGQLYITKRRFCYLVVYTFKDFCVIKVPIDFDFCEQCIVSRLELFYQKYYRPFVAKSL